MWYRFKCVVVVSVLLLQVNYNLMAVNSFMAVTGLYQLGRIA